MEVERLRKLFSLKDTSQLELWSPVVIEMTWLGASTTLHPLHQTNRCTVLSAFAKYIPVVQLLWVSTGSQAYLNPVTTFSPVFTHCFLYIFSLPNYWKEKGFFFSSFSSFEEGEDCFFFSYNFLPIAAMGYC